MWTYYSRTFHMCQMIRAWRQREDKWCALCVSSLKKINKVEVGRSINSSEPKVCEKFFFSFLFSMFFFFASDVICLENLWSQSEGTHSRGRAEHWRMTDRATIKYQMLVTKEAQRNIDLLRSLLRSFYTCHINFHEVVSLSTSPPLPR